MEESLGYVALRFLREISQDNLPFHGLLFVGLFVINWVLRQSYVNQTVIC